MRVSILIAFAALALAFGVAGCHGGDLQGQQTELTRRLTEQDGELGLARRSQASLEARVQELEGQLALAQAEARELRSRTEVRGVIRIPHRRSEWEAHPVGARAEGDPMPPADSADSTPSNSSTDSNADGEFFGIAEGDVAGPRPLLRLAGPAPGVSGSNLPTTPGAHSTEAPALVLPPRPASVPGALPVTSNVPSIMTRPAFQAGSRPPRIPEPVVGPVPDAQVATYREALAHVRERRFAEALAAFETFSAQHPQHPYADNARFWVGEVRFVMRDYAAALHAYETLLSQFPGTSKASDALLKIARCRQQLGDAAGAQSALDRVQRDYPNSVAAQLASREGA